jgi:hypothetical protein
MACEKADRTHGAKLGVFHDCVSISFPLKTRGTMLPNHASLTNFIALGGFNYWHNVTQLYLSTVNTKPTS